MNREESDLPTASTISSNGTNDGKNGGRICWAIAGTFCGGTVQGDFAKKQASCMACDVFKQIKAEQGPEFKMLKSIMEYAKLG